MTKIAISQSRRITKKLNGGITLVRRHLAGLEARVDDAAKLLQTYDRELLRKDAEIAKLRTENELLRTSREIGLKTKVYPYTFYDFSHKTKEELLGMDARNLLPLDDGLTDAERRIKRRIESVINRAGVAEYQQAACVILHHLKGLGAEADTLLQISFSHFKLSRSDARKFLYQK